MIVSQPLYTYNLPQKPFQQQRHVYSLKIVKIVRYGTPTEKIKIASVDVLFSDLCVFLGNLSLIFYVDILS